MISGGSRAWVGAALCATALVAASAMGAEPAAPGAWDLKRLMHELSQVKSARARFVESRQLAILSAPLESSGTLIYAAPGRL